MSKISSDLESIFILKPSSHLLLLILSKNVSYFRNLIIHQHFSDTDFFGANLGRHHRFLRDNLRWRGTLSFALIVVAG